MLVNSMLFRLQPGADRAAWLPGTFQVGLLVHRPGEPSRQTLKEGVEWMGGQWPLAIEREDSGQIICAGATRVPSYATAHGASGADSMGHGGARAPAFTNG